MSVDGDETQYKEILEKTIYKEFYWSLIDSSSFFWRFINRKKKRISERWDTLITSIFFPPFTEVGNQEWRLSRNTQGLTSNSPTNLCTPYVSEYVPLSTLYLKSRDILFNLLRETRRGRSCLKKSKWSQL